MLRARSTQLPFLSLAASALATSALATAALGSAALAQTSAPRTVAATFPDTSNAVRGLPPLAAPVPGEPREHARGARLSR
ncbi:MAG: hypothetical protein FJ298_08605, partial [Planctomycetes bacterium]|nr:hypothetical protein [Planctomycetota bacterium]